MTSSQKKTLNFEDSLKALEAIVESMEKDDIPLDQALEAFQKGLTLSQECQQFLKAAEQKIEIIQNDREKTSS